MKQLLVILSIVISTVSFGQLSTTVDNPTNLVQNVLLGSGVTVSNIQYSGIPASIGSFTANVNNFGISSGIVMTTGTVQNNGDGPHGPNNKSNAGMEAGTPGYPLLSNQIGGASTFDAAVLQFDFVPYSDYVQFNYSFGSEEYIEYVGSQFNDVFGFFISGPGIAGLQNIARLPDGSPVAINTVNHITNSGLYVNNGDGTNAPFNSSNQYLQYDGFTKVLTAESAVQCGQTYHLIIAIADVGDRIYDSGIFLEANSLSSDTPIEAEYTISQNLFNNESIMGEGCVSTTVTLSRDPADAAGSMTVPIDVAGTATEGVDYSDLPNTVTFQPGQTEIVFDFTAFQDGLVEGQESIEIILNVEDPCGNVNPITLELFINDIQDLAVTLSANEMVCPGDDVTINSTVTGGAEPYTYSWNTGENTPSITVNPANTTTYTLDVTDACTGVTVQETFEVVVPVFQPLVLNETADITEICPFIPATLFANPSGGSANGNYSYSWSSSTSGFIGDTPSINVQPGTTTTYTVTVTDDCGNTATENIVYTITSEPLTLTMSPNVEICPGDSVQISVTPNGGYGDFFYFWTHSGETTPTVWVKPDRSTTYTVIVSDECQTFTVEGTTDVTIIQPTADFETTSTTFFNNLPITFLNTSVNAVNYEWDFGDLQTSTEVNPSNTYDEPGTYYITLVAIDEKGCTDTIVKPIGIEEEWYIYVPNTFTPDGDRLNNTFRISTYGIQPDADISVFNRWGEIIFTASEITFEWDGTYNGVYVNDGTYTYKIAFTTNSGRNRTIHGHINVLK